MPAAVVLLRQGKRRVARALRNPPFDQHPLSYADWRACVPAIRSVHDDYVCCVRRSVAKFPGDSGGAWDARRVQLLSQVLGAAGIGGAPGQAPAAGPGGMVSSHACTPACSPALVLFCIPRRRDCCSPSFAGTYPCSDAEGGAVSASVRADDSRSSLLLPTLRAKLRRGFLKRFSSNIDLHACRTNSSTCTKFCFVVFVVSQPQSGVAF